MASSSIEPVVNRDNLFLLSIRQNRGIGGFIPKCCDYFLNYPDFAAVVITVTPLNYHS